MGEYLLTGDKTVEPGLHGEGPYHGGDYNMHRL